MNALDMWLASTFDLPWSAPTSQAPGSAANGAAARDEAASEQADTLDIELLSELISAQDNSSATTDAPQQSQVWSQTSAAPLWTAPTAGVEQVPVLSEVGLLEAEGWLSSPDSQESVQTDPLLGSLTDIAALGSLTLGSPDSQPTSPPTSESDETISLPVSVTNLSALNGTAAMTTVQRPAKVSRADSDASSGAGSDEEGEEHESRPLKKKRKTPRRQPPKDSVAYKRRREQNNQAVRRCRQKTKERNDENQRAADDLREENNLLKEKVNNLFREVRNLRALLGVGSVPAESDVPTLGGSSISHLAPAASCQASTQSIWPGLGANLVL